MRHRALGRHFRISEFTAASSAPLSQDDLVALERLVRVYLDPMRDMFGRCTVHSAKRSEARNREVGGARRSYHLYELRPGEAAADVSFRRGTPAHWAAAAKRLGPTWTVTYPSHVHVDTRGLKR